MGRESDVSLQPPAKNVKLAVRNMWWRRQIRTKIKNVPDCLIDEINYDFTGVIF